MFCKLFKGYRLGGAPSFSLSRIEGSEPLYLTSWPHIEQTSLWLGNAWETITLFDTSDASVISSRRYPGHWCKLCLCLLSIGDVMRRSRDLDEDDRKRSRRSSKRCLSDARLRFSAPRSSHLTSRRGVRRDFAFSVEFEGFDTSSFSLAETFGPSSSSLGKPSLSYTTNSRSGESSVEIQYLNGKTLR